MSIMLVSLISYQHPNNTVSNIWNPATTIRHTPLKTDDNGDYVYLASSDVLYMILCKETLMIDM